MDLQLPARQEPQGGDVWGAVLGGEPSTRRMLSDPERWLVVRKLTVSLETICKCHRMSVC